jgi:hypothetical protein
MEQGMSNQRGDDQDTLEALRLTGRSQAYKSGKQHEDDREVFADLVTRFILNIHPRIPTANMDWAQSLFFSLKADILRSQKTMETLCNAERKIDGEKHEFPFRCTSDWEALNPWFASFDE